MNRKFYALPLALLFAILLSVSGCGSNEAQFEETAMADAEEKAKAEAYRQKREALEKKASEYYKQ